MARCSITCAVAALMLAAPAGLVYGGAGNRTATAQTAELIEQLGADTCAERDAASKALETIGRPAFDALRQAVASSGDLEIRRRAEQLLLVGLAAETRQLTGTWRLVSSKDPEAKVVDLGAAVHTLTFTDNRWEWRQNGERLYCGTYRLNICPGGLTGMDLIVPEGACKGTALSLCRIDGDKLHYAKSETNQPRPVSFAMSPAAGWCYYHMYQRVKN